MHAVHTDKVEAAATLPYVPATHEVHTEDVLAVAMLLYLPAEHAVHVYETLRAAVQLWCRDRVAALAQHGPIGEWDMSGVRHEPPFLQH